KLPACRSVSLARSSSAGLAVGRFLDASPPETGRRCAESPRRCSCRRRRCKDVGVSWATRGGAGRVVGKGLLAVLEVDDMRAAVVAAHPAAQGVPAVEDVVDAVVVDIGSLEL